MSEAAASGTLGPRAVAELRAIAAARVLLAEQAAGVDRKEAVLLALIAESQGCAADSATRFDYDLDAGTWRALEAPRATTVGGGD